MPHSASGGWHAAWRCAPVPLPACPAPPPSPASQESVTVFVHDVERPVEAALVQQYFAADAGIVSLGLLQGATGNLAAFRVVA